MESTFFTTELTKKLTDTLAANTRLGSALADYQSFSGTRAIEVEPLAGTGNQSFKVRLDQDVVVIRLNADTGFLGVDREVEKLILETIADWEIAPQLKLWREDYLVIEFIESSSVLTTRSIARTLHTLHSIPVPTSLKTEIPWTPVATIRDYLKLAPEAEAAFAGHLTLLEKFDWTSLGYAICHIDLNPNNMLAPLEGGPAQFIDWEYARYGPIAYDFAVYCETHHSSPVDIDTLRSLYPDAPRNREIAICQFAYYLIELLWRHITTPLDYPMSELIDHARAVSLARY